MFGETGNTTAITDASGSVGTINNTGTIIAEIFQTDSDVNDGVPPPPITGFATAIDLSQNGGGVTVNQTADVPFTDEDGVDNDVNSRPATLIRGRILTHAKWQLLHTLKPVKEVAREVGFGDELYFSRLFKKATGYSPSFFREFETAIRGGSNLSMFSHLAPILRPDATADT